MAWDNSSITMNKLPLRPSDAIVGATTQRRSMPDQTDDRVDVARRSARALCATTDILWVN
jgi:hypothetical protein